MIPMYRIISQSILGTRYYLDRERAEEAAKIRTRMTGIQWVVQLVYWSER